MNRQIRFLALLLIIFSIYGCGLTTQVSSSGSYAPPPNNPLVNVIEEKEISPANGGIVSANVDPANSVAIEIPAGALASSTNISIGTVSNAPALSNFESDIVYEFGPSTTFLNPVTITINYDETSFTNEHGLRLYTYNEALSKWELVPSQDLNIDNNLITAQLEHFSSYTVMQYSPVGDYPVSCRAALVVYNNDDTLFGYEVYYYDETGKEYLCEGLTSAEVLTGYNTSEYDAYGNLILFKSYYVPNALQSSITFEYNSHNNLIKQSSYQVPNNLTNENFYDYVYDQDEKAIRRNIYSDETRSILAGYSLLVYNNDKLISEIGFDVAGITQNYQTYQYDINGNDTQISFYNADNLLGSYRTYEYDSNGNQTKYSMYDAPATLTYRCTYEYDINGNKIRENRFNGAGILQKYFIIERTPL